ncbi:MAG: hypothetical protein JWO19_3355 [Bryobacterales bacterium]|nr:hypothetical protein [Bryobacterales bacterium]
MHCPECERLWYLYSGLVQEQTSLFTEYRDAVRAHELERVQQIDLAIEAAERFRKLGKQELEAHQATHYFSRASVA